MRQLRSGMPGSLLQSILSSKQQCLRGLSSSYSYLSSGSRGMWALGQWLPISAEMNKPTWRSTQWSHMTLDISPRRTSISSVRQPSLGPWLTSRPMITGT
uniref:Uncharacterized protein n=1 Tax=uncultured marine virus TaxID=186617 RepID=A0A0F7LBX2_9VIRU|nr:hypothetical protein P60_gp21 [uncultured marine virus]